MNARAAAAAASGLKAIDSVTNATSTAMQVAKVTSLWRRARQQPAEADAAERTSNAELKQCFSDGR
jgi:hypothetical protein